MELDGIELGPKMQACSERERKFVWFYLLGDENGRLNASEAARQAGYVDNDNGAIRRRGHQLLHRERVLAALDEVGKKEFRSLLIPTIKATRALIENKDHPDHAGTLKSTLSRLGLVERSGVDVNVSGEVTLNQTDEAVNDLRILKRMGLSRDRLLEIFGFSGLDRYEKMLAIADQRAGVSRETGLVIEHEAKDEP